MVLDVAAASLLAGHDGLDRALALELAQDRLVRAPDDVSEDVEPAAVGHSEHDLVGAARGGEIDRLVEHRDHHVEPLDGELLLAEERAPQVALHPLHLAQPGEQAHPLVARERTAVAARLDRLPQPDALLVVGDVLDLVGDRAGVGLPQPRQRVGERLALDEEAEERGGNPRLELGRQLGDQALGLERRIAVRLRAQRVNPRSQVTVHAERLDERHRGGDAAEELLVRGSCRHRCRCGRSCGRRGRGDRRRVSVPVRGSALEQARETRLATEERLGLAFEQVAPFLGHGAGVVEVLLEEQRCVAGVQPVDVGTSHVQDCCSSAAALPERVARDHRDREPEEEADGTDEHGRELEAALFATHPRGDERDCERRQDQA